MVTTWEEEEGARKLLSLQPCLSWSVRNTDDLSTFMYSGTPVIVSWRKPPSQNDLPRRPGALLRVHRWGRHGQLYAPTRAL